MFFMRTTFIFSLLFFLTSKFCLADEPSQFPIANDTLLMQDIEMASVEIDIELPGWKYRLVDRIKKNAGENNKVVAAILAFPLFGIIGLHRIYLGTKPYVPVVYIATLGGCAGVLPMIDFFAIIFADKETFDCYKENPKVFMWIK